MTNVNPKIESSEVSSVAGGLQANTYSYVVSDTNGCTVSGSIQVPSLEGKLANYLFLNELVILFL